MMQLRMKVFRRKQSLHVFIIKGDLTRAHLGNNIVALPEHLMSTASTIKQTSGAVVLNLLTIATPFS
jgi:hypothetical protein